MKCNHEWYEREAALIDGMCPLCLSNNIVDGVSAADRVALLRADVERLYSERTTLMSVVASARERAEHAEARLAEAEALLDEVRERMSKAETTARVLIGQLPEYSEGQQMLSSLATKMGDSVKRIRAFRAADSAPAADCPECGGSGVVNYRAFDGTEEGHIEEAACACMAATASQPELGAK